MKLAFISRIAIFSALLLEKVNGDSCDTSDCTSCIESGCAWAVGSCLESCSMIADVSCYSSRYSSEPAAEICQRKDDDEADSAACSSQTDCGGCVQTLKSDGSYCQWYAEDNFGFPIPSPYCSTGGCNMVDCGSSVCPLRVENTMIDESVTTTTLTLDCSEATECSDCLNGNCAWSPELGCFDSCVFIGDASCFSPERITDTVQEVCDRIDVNEQNQELCSQPEDCASCINTIQTDGATCKWYAEYPDSTSIGDPYCGTGACNMDGVCGSDTCTTPATISTTSGASVGSIQCFAGNNQVKVLMQDSSSGAVTKQIKELRIGDLIQVENDKYSRIYSFAHLDSSLKSSFLQIYSDNLKSPLEVTPEHLLFTKSGGNSIEIVAASLVKIGDELLLPSGGTSTVTKISNMIRNDGIYAPLTEKGTIAVSGVVASCYVALPSSQKFSSTWIHWLSHMATMPRRRYCQMHWESCQNESYTSDGLATWAHTMWLLANPILECDIETGLLTTTVLSILMVKFVMAIKKRKTTA